MIVYRRSEWDTPTPLSPPRDHGRYHTAGGTTAHYWCTHPHGPWAELLRAEGPVDPATAGFLRRLWVARIDVDPIVIGFDQAADVGLSPHDLVADDHTACRQLADRLVTDGIDTIRVPSAALPGTDNVVLFGDRVQTDYDPVFADPVVDLPTAVAAADATVPAGVAERVCHIGQQHAGLAAWRNGETLDYDQPRAPTKTP